MTLYALNLFDLADNDLYRRYSRRSPEAVAKHGGDQGASDAASSRPPVAPATRAG